MKLPHLPASLPAAKDPGWPRARQVHRSCPVCRADEPEGVVCRRPDDLDVLRCGRCRMLYLGEVPDEETLAAFYAKYSEWKGLAPDVGARSDGPRERIARALATRRDPKLRILEVTGKLTGLRLLEIGASHGGFLEQARAAGAHVMAVEADEDALRHLRARGIPAWPEIPAGERFDVVCAFQIFEHLVDPHRMAASISASLENDGRLLVGVPNAGEVELTGPPWVGFRVDLEHVNYFSVESLGRLLSEHGLFLEQFWYTDQPAVTRPSRVAPKRSLASRLLGVGAAALDRFLEAPRIVRGGSFVLTLLARKTPYGDG